MDIAVLSLRKPDAFFLDKLQPTVTHSTRRSLPKKKNEVVRFHRHGICRPVSPPCLSPRQVRPPVPPDINTNTLVPSAVAHEGHDEPAAPTTTSVAAVTTAASHQDHAGHSAATTLTAATTAATVVMGGAKNTTTAAPTGTLKPVVTVNSGGRMVPFWRWYM